MDAVRGRVAGPSVCALAMIVAAIIATRPAPIAEPIDWRTFVAARRLDQARAEFDRMQTDLTGLGHTIERVLAEPRRGCGGSYGFARRELERLRREQVEARKRIYELKRQRQRHPCPPIKLSRECLDNPLAKSCM
jgi:hypothetical protein